MSTDRALEAARRVIAGAGGNIHLHATNGDIQEVARALLALSEEVERMRDALERIRDHWASNYDHQFADTEAYRGSYGIGIVDGHRACASIARTALTPPSSQPGNSEEGSEQ